VQREERPLRKPSLVVSLALVVAATATIATSDPVERVIGSWWAGQLTETSTVRFDLGEGGSAWLRAAGNASTFVELYLVIPGDDQRTFSEAVWQLTTVDGQSYRRSGMFMGNAPGNSRGAVAWLGRVCTGDAVTEDDTDCLPCDLADGCVFEAQVSTCLATDTEARPPDLYVRLTDEDGRVVVCESGCGRAGYIASSVTALDADLCSEASEEMTPSP
jgi:hypothetical protein